jgi:very-short-patch-repair endonuclease
VTPSDEEKWRFGSEGPNQNAKVRVSQLSKRQFGRIATWQLRSLGVGKATVHAWVAASYLHRVLPHVYAVGHTAPSTEADLAAALLYAGPGAALSHGTAAWWYGLIDNLPTTIHVTTPRRRKSGRRLKVHARRTVDIVTRRGLPVTAPVQTMFDFATVAGLARLRHVLASAEYAGLLDAKDVHDELERGRRGRRGSVRLRRALAAHEPRLARTKSRFERALIALCEARGIPLPEINVRVEGHLVDAIWRGERLIVELDGYGNHHTPAQIRRDHRRDLHMRRHGFATLRYTEDQLDAESDDVVRDILAGLARTS